jgi:hypothetical protein
VASGESRSFAGIFLLAMTVAGRFPARFADSARTRLGFLVFEHVRRVEPGLVGAWRTSSNAPRSRGSGGRATVALTPQGSAIAKCRSQTPAA